WAFPVRSSTRPACRRRRPSSRSTRTARPRSSISLTSASWATCSRSFRRRSSPCTRTSPDMATYSGSLRSGLPRVEGGDPWPPAGTIGEALDEGASPLAEELETGSSAEVVDEEPTEAVADAEASDVVEDSTDSAEFADEDSDAEVPLRRGLPRVVGGEPWPPEGFAPVGVKPTGGSAAPAADSASEAGSPEAAAADAASPEAGVDSEAEAEIGRAPC